MQSYTEQLESPGMAASIVAEQDKDKVAREYAPFNLQLEEQRQRLMHSGGMNHSSTLFTGNSPNVASATTQ